MWGDPFLCQRRPRGSFANARTRATPVLVRIRSSGRARGGGVTNRRIVCFSPHVMIGLIFIKYETERPACACEPRRRFDSRSSRDSRKSLMVTTVASQKKMLMATVCTRLYQKKIEIKCLRPGSRLVGSDAPFSSSFFMPIPPAVTRQNVRAFRVGRFVV